MAHAWSMFRVATEEHRSFSLEEIRTLDVDAVRACEGFEYRYREGGLVSWFSFRTEEELPVIEGEGLPADLWWHLLGCNCAACRESTTVWLSAPRRAYRDRPVPLH